MLRTLRSRRRVPARRLGVSLSSLSSEAGPAQLTLLNDDSPTEESGKDRDLSTAVDRINRKLGGKGLGPARLVKSGERRSP